MQSVVPKVTAGSKVRVEIDTEPNLIILLQHVAFSLVGPNALLLPDKTPLG